MTKMRKVLYLNLVTRELCIGANSFTRTPGGCNDGTQYEQ